MDSWVRIAHRGASGSAPENTMAAFRRAVALGVDAVELDLHGTADGEIVVMHDSTLDRTTNLSGPINKTTLARIRGADAGAWFAAEFAGESVPTLTETLACLAKETVAVLEIKDPLIAEGVVSKIREGRALDMTVVISFDLAVLRAVRILEPRLATGWLVGGTQVSPIKLCQDLAELGGSLLNVNHQLITLEFSYEVRRRGVALWCWTVDDPARMREVQRFGVQGITSNYPERFAEI